MTTRHLSPLLAISLLAAACLLLSPASASANGTVTEKEYSTSLTEATGIVRILVAIFGGLIAVLGIYVTLKGVAGKSDLSLSVKGKTSLQLKRISQGVVIVIVGTALLVAAVYLLPDKRTERTIKGDTITTEQDPSTGKVKHITAD